MFGKTLALLAFTALAEASGGCPAIWSTIASDLSKSFIGSNGCTDLARGAIRFAFHDSGSYSSKTPAYAPATGGADGSLLLSSVEISREENAGLQQYYAFLLGKYDQYKSQVGAADLVQFAASVAIVSCPGGPKVQTVVGRKDTSTPAPDNLLPKAFGPGAAQQVLIQLFEDKGISQPELAALIGAHTASKAELVPRSATFKYELKRLTSLADPTHRVEERDVISWEGWMWRDFGPESTSAEILALRWTADSLEHLVELAEKLQALRQKLGESGVEGSNIDMDSVRRNVEVAFEAIRASERRYENSHPLELPPLVNHLAYDIVVPYSSNPEFRIWVARYTKAEPTTADQHVQHTVLQLTVMPPDVTIIDNPHDSPVVGSMIPSDVVVKREESAEPSPTDNRQLSAELGSPSLSREQPQGRRFSLVLSRLPIFC